MGLQLTTEKLVGLLDPQYKKRKNNYIPLEKSHAQQVAENKNGLSSCLKSFQFIDEC